MWRINPALKLTLFVIAFCILVDIGARFLYFASPFADFAAETVVLYTWIYGLENGLLAGLSLSLLMVLVSMVFFREIHKPKFYRYTMVILALLVTVTRRGGALESVRAALDNPDVLHVWAAAITVLILALQIFICHIAAGRYLRHVLSIKEKRKTAPLNPT